jgi:hypothetical protein
MCSEKLDIEDDKKYIFDVIQANYTLLSSNVHFTQFTVSMFMIIMFDVQLQAGVQLSLGTRGSCPPHILKLHFCPPQFYH